MALYDIGSQGEDVRAIQQRLKDAGFDPGPTDSLYGPQTASAVKNFQQTAGIDVDSIFGDQTDAALTNYATKIPPPTGQVLPAVAPVAAPEQVTPATAPITAQPTSNVPNPESIAKQGYDPNFDYDAATRIMKAQGQDTKLFDVQRENKIAAASDEQLKTWGIDRSGKPISKDGIPTFTPPATVEPPKADPNIKLILDDLTNTKPYESPYAAMLQGMINKITNRSFNYDPATDQAFQTDSKALTQYVMETMNERGILNSSITADNVSQQVANLIGQYRDKAYGRFMDEGTQLLQQANFIMGVDEQGYQREQDKYNRKAKLLDFYMGMDENAFNKFKDARDTEYNRSKDLYSAAMDKYTAEKQIIKDAWDDVSNRGYVSNENSIILKLDPGTLSKEAREAVMKREQQIEDNKQAEEFRMKEINKNQKNAIEMEGIRTANDLRMEEARTANDLRLEGVRQAGIAEKERIAEEKTDVTKMGTPEQLMYYGNAFTYLLEQNDNNGYKAYQQLLRERADYVASMGIDLFNQLAKDFQDYGKSQGTASQVNDEGELTSSQQFSQQQTVTTKALALRKEVVKGGYDIETGEMTSDTPKYSDEDIATYVVNSGLSEEGQLAVLASLGIDIENLGGD